MTNRTDKPLTNQPIDRPTNQSTNQPNNHVYNILTPVLRNEIVNKFFLIKDPNVIGEINVNTLTAYTFNNWVLYQIDHGLFDFCAKVCRTKNGSVKVVNGSVIERAGSIVP